MKNPKQLDLFSKKIPEWKRRGFKSRHEWLKAKEFDRAWRHMEQANCWISFFRKSEKERTSS